MSHYSVPLIAILIMWITLIFVASGLPSILRSMKLDDVIDASMIKTIRAVIVAFLIITIVGLFSLFASAFIPY